MATKRQKMKLSDVVNVNAPQLTYFLLLIASFLVGYLLARVQALEGGFAVTAGTQQAAPATGDTAQAPQGPVDVENGHFPVKGDEDADVTIVEFSDFECPFCGSFYNDTLPQIISEYIDTGMVKMYYRHYPLSFHPKAVPLALASECANDQDKFWEMHDKIFDNNATISSVTDETIKGWVTELGMNTGEFNECYDSKEHQAKVDEDFAAGQAAGVSGTPTFYINGKQIVGAQPFESFKAVIDEELNN